MDISLFKFTIHGLMKWSGMVLGLIHHLNGPIEWNTSWRMTHRYLLYLYRLAFYLVFSSDKVSYVVWSCLYQKSKDGIFWMSWQDFQIHFRLYSVHGQWWGYSPGGCQDYASWNENPQFRLRATGPDASLPIHVFITLTRLYLSNDPQEVSMPP